MAPAEAPRFYTDPRTWEFNQNGKPYYSTGLRKRFQLDATTPVLIHALEPTADIEYDIDEAKYRARVEQRLKSDTLEKEVPVDWPQAVHGSLVWTKDSFETGDEYVYRLTSAEKAEVLGALEKFKGIG